MVAIFAGRIGSSKKPDLVVSLSKDDFFA